MKNLDCGCAECRRWLEAMPAGLTEAELAAAYDGMHESGYPTFCAFMRRIEAERQRLQPGLNRIVQRLFFGDSDTTTP
jgi:hypothetical protein